MTESEAGVSHPAVLSVTKKARADQSVAEARLTRHGIRADRVSQAIDGMRTNGRLTLNFHPDRRDSMGRTVAAGLLADGRYRPQFETGISNGGRFAVPGGDRVRWEALLFGSVYDTGSMTRPVYGALDLFNDPYGGAPRFGSSFVVLEQHCLGRATFCVGDSHVGPVDVGTSLSLISILAGAVEDCLLGDGFGRHLFADSFVEGLAFARGDSSSARELDRYIEAQVHDAAAIGRALDDLLFTPPSVSGDPEESPLQRYKKLWHCCLRFGEPQTQDRL